MTILMVILEHSEHFVQRLALPCCFWNCRKYRIAQDRHDGDRAGNLGRRGRGS
ncbi:MAG: hypothetical protein MZV65_04190 [Chromatiales bacterium]|nr:hypothetical protein [Chromatiales bacterium]